jgi:hypothetical protein
VILGPVYCTSLHGSEVAIELAVSCLLSGFSRLYVAVILREW